MAQRPSLVLLLPFVLLGCGTTSSATMRARPTHWAQPMLGADVANWHRVDDQLYRCGQPDRQGMRALAAQGVRTVVNLRSWHSDRDEIAGTGMALVEVPATAGSMDYADLVQALRAVVQAEKPVAVHCWHGSDRTGAVVAAWRDGRRRLRPFGAVRQPARAGGRPRPRAAARRRRATGAGSLTPTPDRQGVDASLRRDHFFAAFGFFDFTPDFFSACSIHFAGPPAT